MTAIPGVNCDCALFHASVDSGEPVGFIVEQKVKYGPPVTIHWEAYDDWSGEVSEVRHLWFVALLGDDLVNPDGSKHTESPADTYDKLIEILTQHRDIGLITRKGIITGLRVAGHVLIENIYPNIQTLEIHLTTRLTNFAPVDTTRYMNSFWVDETTYVAGIMHWNNSYWRS
jgi:hypothetical protein